MGIVCKILTLVNDSTLVKYIESDLVIFEDVKTKLGSIDTGKNESRGIQ